LTNFLARSKDGGKKMKIVYWLKGDDKPYLYKGSLKKWEKKDKQGVKDYYVAKTGIMGKRPNQ